MGFQNSKNSPRRARQAGRKENARGDRGPVETEDPRWPATVTAAGTAPIRLLLPGPCFCINLSKYFTCWWLLLGLPIAD